MSHTIQPTQVEAEEIVCPEFNPSPKYRSFIARLRLARLKRGLSIADMSDAVGLTFRLAHEFENIVTPLPFEWLEVWCETIGVPFADYLAIYRADEREWDERQAELDQNVLCITSTEASAPETLASAIVNRSFGFFNLLCAAFDRIARFFHSLFFML